MPIATIDPMRQSAVLVCDMCVLPQAAVTEVVSITLRM
jgi:hypothetical protein